MTGEQVELGTGPAAAGRARREARRQLSGLAGDDLDTVVLLVSELVTNAVLHAGGPVRLRLLRTASGVRIEVRDPSPRLPQQRRALDLQRVSGRGSHLVQQLAARSGAALEAGGKVVWCEVDLTAAG